MTAALKQSEWRQPLYRGLKSITIRDFKPDEPVNGHYGTGIYFSPKRGEAASWATNGIVVEYKPTLYLRLKTFTDVMPDKDLMKNLGVQYDGIYLSNPNQEAGQQIILKSTKKIKAIGYWPVSGDEKVLFIPDKDRKPLSAAVEESAHPVILNGMESQFFNEIEKIAVMARYKDLNRYSFRQGHIFGNPRGKERFRILDVFGNYIIFKELNKNHVEKREVESLIKEWNAEGIKELTAIDRILDTIKSSLTPFLGGVLVAALISWLQGRLK